MQKTENSESIFHDFSIQGVVVNVIKGGD